jgi:GntR family phosphonate transport system transcriptional regulator
MLTRPPLDSDEAVYHRIARDLEQEISRRYQPGMFLPSEQVLAEHYGVNRHTLRRAVDELIEAGLVERRRGRGTLVIDPAIVFPIRSRTRFTENLEAQGHAADTRLLFVREAEATGGVAEALHIKEGVPVLWLEMLRLVEELPFSIASHFFPLPRFAALASAYHGGSLHGHIESAYGIHPRRQCSRISALMPRGDDARLLRMPRNRPVLRAASINGDPADDEPIEYCVTRFRSDRCHVEVEP